LRACIRRGSEEIGGSCIELESQGKRLILDLGLPLDVRPEAVVDLPHIDGLGGGDASLLGIVISHSHPDHYGLVPNVHPSVPVYLGQATQQILKEAMFFSPMGADLHAAAYLVDRRELSIGPFTVTPYLVDHSAFDAYALLVEADGDRLFYSGDLRAHGRKPKAFRNLVDDPPSRVDALLLEGTTIGRPHDTGAAASEADVEERCVSLFAQTEGMILAAYSGQNIDRLVTMHRAAKRSGRTLVVDLYTAAIAKAAGHPSIPQGEWESVHVFVPLSQRIRVKHAEEFDRVSAVRSRRLFPEDVAARAGELVMTFRGSMTRDLQRAECLDGARCVWSMWAGYLAGPSGVRLREWLDRNEISLSVIHASGHAPVTDLQRLSRAIGARAVVPIHTVESARYPDLFENVVARRDDEWWPVGAASNPHD